MPAQIHEYPVVAHWDGGRDGKGDLTPQGSGKTIDINVPPEFMGPGGETNPEELLTSAVTGCYSITFGIIAANRKLPVTSITVNALGEVEQNGASSSTESSPCDLRSRCPQTLPMSKYSRLWTSLTRPTRTASLQMRCGEMSKF
jgi:organic hydroperoxide reductase OsmC/OhrA